MTEMRRRVTRGFYLSARMKRGSQRLVWEGEQKKKSWWPACQRDGMDSKIAGQVGTVTGRADN